MLDVKSAHLSRVICVYLKRHDEGLNEMFTFCQRNANKAVQRNNSGTALLLL